MEYLQYNHVMGLEQLAELVLNLIINGIPSILEGLWSKPSYDYEF